MDTSLHNPDENPAQTPRPETRLQRWSRRVIATMMLLTVLGVGGLALLRPDQVGLAATQKPKEADKKAPELSGGVAWLNTGKPLKMEDLKGKIVLLDFWTLCCINCIHTLPDLFKLEKKYANELVVIGVHSAKFENEKNSESIRKALLRYEITHPVVNDANMEIWQTYGSNSWPTLVLIDPEGNLVARGSGEGLYEAVDKEIAKQIQIHKEKGTLNEKPIRFDTAAFREKADTPLYFPGKILADATGKRLFIADSTHHRIVMTDMDGKTLAVAGTGQPGLKDGSLTEAQFDDPQGMALQGDLLYVADRRNHSIRVIDWKNKTVKLIAGKGQQDRDSRGEKGKALEVGLNSPWDLWINGQNMFIAMAGHHQIWVMDLVKQTVQNYAGDGRENIKDGPLDLSRFAQPSGLASDGENLYVADCEISAIRKVPMNGKGRVETLVGKGLFDFGFKDGPGNTAQLQHAIGVAYQDGIVYVADTYNNTIRTIEVASNTVGTLVPAKEPLFNEPAGLSIANGLLYVADTNAHRIRTVNLKTKEVKTLEITGLQPVKK